MDTLIHDGVLTEQGKQELIQNIKIAIDIIEHEKSLEGKEEKDYFDKIKIIPSKNNGKLTRALALKKSYQFSFFGVGDIPLTWYDVSVSFQQSYRGTKPYFSFEDFKKLNLKLEAILFYEKGKPSNFEYYKYVASLKDNPKIKISFSVYKDDFNKVDHLPQNFYDVEVSQNDNGIYESSDAKTLYLNKK